MPGEALNPAAIKRHPLDVRIAHWTVAVSFILLALSGLGLFFPPFFFLTAILGGGETQGGERESAEDANCGRTNSRWVQAWRPVPTADSKGRRHRMASETDPSNDMFPSCHAG